MTFLLVAVAAAFLLGGAGGYVAFRALHKPLSYQFDLSPLPPLPPPPAPPPWAHHGDVFELPADLLRQLSPPGDVVRASAETDRILDIVEEARQIGGFHTPLLVMIDSVGRCCTEDGLHRLEAAAILDYAMVPVRFRYCERINGWGRPVKMLASALAAHLADVTAPSHRE